MEEKRTDLLALLLRPELPNVQKELPTAEYRVKRLSEALGTDVVFKLRALPYGKVKSIRDSVAGDPRLDILLAGCVEPDLKAKELKEKYGGATPRPTAAAPPHAAPEGEGHAAARRDRGSQPGGGAAVRVPPHHH